MVVDKKHGIVLAIGLLSLLISAPIIRYAAAPALVVVMGRLIFAWPVTASVAYWRRDRWPPLGAAVAGSFLAAHWILWVAAVQETSVANATVLLSTAALGSAVLSKPLLGEPVAKAQWSGLCIALAGIWILVGGGTGSDGANPGLRGDLFALASAAAWVGYTFVGRRARQDSDFWAYTAATYGAAALCTFIALALVGSGRVGSGLGPWHTAAPWMELSVVTWLALVGLAIFPTLLGHGSVNYLLRFMRAADLNLWMLTEPVGASLLAWPLFGEVPTLRQVLGAALTLVGVAMGVKPRQSNNS